MKRIEIVGKTFVSNSGEIAVVVEYLYNINTEYYYLVRFSETGAEKILEKRNIVRGHFRDDYRKTIFSVACKGSTCSTKPLINRIAFKRWYAMIERCYNPKASSYKSYGAKGVTVSDEWLCFENYFNDLQSILGFDESKYLSGEIQLDKDMLAPGNTVYCKEKCQFVPRISNIRYRSSVRRPFRAISPNGQEYVFYSQAECAETLGLTARTIGKVLDGHLKSHKGWKFKYEV